MQVNPTPQSKGPADYWQRPSFARKYVLGNTRGLMSSPSAQEFYVTCMMAIGQGLQYLAGERPGRILDMGCGHATRSAAIKSMLGCEVVGADFSEPMLTEARGIMEQIPEAQRVELVHADVNSLPFPDNSFDAAFCYGLLMSLPDAEPGVAELLRVTRYGFVAIDECDGVMEPKQREAWDKVRTETFPGRIFWHDYIRVFRHAAQFVTTPLTVPASWDLGTPPGYARFIVGKRA